MAFLFKSKKNQERVLASRDGPPVQQTPASRLVREEKQPPQRSTPTGSVTSIDNENGTPSPDQYARRGVPQPETQPSIGPQQQSDLPFRNGPQQPAPNASLYPWSQRRLTFNSNLPSPFPRYGAAVNSTASKEGDIYVMGGLINSTSVRGDLWLVEAGGNMSCYPLNTTAEGPGPRVGHASLLVGNAFIVYGGDTKIDDEDILDETLYLLNTSTRQWSRALPAGPRPSGRYGHSLNILGSKIYIFGGQVEGYFMNDLSAFDLNQLQQPNNRWEMLIKSSDISGLAPGEIPPARTNHSMITFQDKMYLFGGTNGVTWFNDVWCYDPSSNSWSQLDCIGYIPIPREGHAAALVDDVMYVFGGRTETGEDLGDLAAFRISSRRWYTFQNMGPSPSARSGHSMTTVGKQVVVVGGEPSTQGNAVKDLAIAYCLDTTKIRYPNDAQIQAQRTRRPSQGETPATNRLPSRDGSNGPPISRGISTMGATPSGYRPGAPNTTDPNAQQQPGGSRLPRAAGTSTPSGPPPQQQPPKPVVAPPSAVERLRNTSSERSASPKPSSQTQSPVTREPPKEAPESPVTNGRRTPNTNSARTGSKPESVSETPKSNPPPSRQARSQGSGDSNTEPTLKTVANRPSSPPPPSGTSRQTSNPLARRGSGRNSQTVALLKELDSARNRNAWYASELELARKAGYAPSGSLSPMLDSNNADAFDDEDKPLIEALLVMKQELTNVQSSVDKQAIVAAKQIAEAEKQRDVAIQEAVYAKAKLAAVGGAPHTPMDTEDAGDRVMEAKRKLAQALTIQKGLQNQVELLGSELESEKRSRQLADETASAAQKRMGDLESYRQMNSSEGENLRATLHARERELREQSVIAAESAATLQLLRIEKQEVDEKYKDALGNTQDNTATLEGLRQALAASDELKATLEQKLEEERSSREKVETKLTKLKGEHEARTAELVAATQRLRDVEELSDKHSKEAQAHRQALVSGLEKLSARSVAKDSSADADKVIALTAQATAASGLVKKYQQEADAASDKLRSAEGRIAGLEVYQEQASREGVAIRKQLQAALKDTQSLQAANSNLKHRLASQQLETNAMTVQHNTLKDLLSERGISPTNAARARGITSPRDRSPVTGRTRELEQQLAAAQAAHEETKQAYSQQAQESEATYREKLSQLENDYSSAIHYVKGTEKMLKQMKTQLGSYKTENTRLKTEYDNIMEQAGSASDGAAKEWQAERDGLQKKIDSLQKELQSSTSQLEGQLGVVRKELGNAVRERDSAIKSSAEAAKRLSSHRMDLEELQEENTLLERRAQDAEQKVSLLLDQVESSVDSYRRRSRQVPSMDSATLNAAAAAAPIATNGLGHTREDSSEVESTYGGGLEARNSAALDSLATELETLRSHWEATNKNYRLSTNFDFDSGTPKKDDDTVGLSASLADWRKRLDSEERPSERSTSQDRNNNARS
ncbi:hypothetical protein MKZ38_001324 [Zalerion maritima]|uniref:Uncharacterized protein n=1 Tax=Zalerion maritima TaxID=339359 RepID=A0AAD5RQC8_9PEZI|nr:hypothetical protein MKZ38_001324 [Zalerion maritima]